MRGRSKVIGRRIYDAGIERRARGVVIRAGDAIMEIVPDSDDLQIEARLQPSDIDQLRVGQKTFIRFSAFNQRTVVER
jgi:multidrug resistance efflux pump